MDSILEVCKARTRLCTVYWRKERVSSNDFNILYYFLAKIMLLFIIVISKCINMSFLYLYSNDLLRSSFYRLVFVRLVFLKLSDLHIPTLHSGEFNFYLS